MRRRDFLKASAVTAGASMLDGCSTPEEKFIVQRVRQGSALPGGTIWVPGVCRQCAAACGIQIRIVDGNARKIEGNEAHPVSRGGVCALGHSLLQEIYNPDRILQAQQGDGAGTFTAMEWDDAIARVASAIGDASPERIAIVASDRSGLTGALWRRFADAIGAPPPAFLEAPEWEVERRAAQIALGVSEYPDFDIAGAEHVLSIGAPFADRWRSPVHYIRQLADMRRGRRTRRGRLIQAEARMSLTAANADLWLPIRPGSEGVLARAIAGVIMDEGMASAAAIRRYRVLFPDAPPSVEEAGEACDVAEEKILQAAEEIGNSENALVIAGGSAAAHTNGLFNVTAALALNVLLDNLGRPGGVYAPASFGLERGLGPAGAGDTPISEVVARLRGEGDPVDLLLVAEADPVHTLPGGWGLADAIGNAGTVVALSSFQDDTTVHADVIVPLATELERFEAAAPAGGIGLPVLGVAEAAADPVGDGQHPADVIIALAGALGDDVAASFPWRNFQALVQARVEENLGSLPGGAGQTARNYLNAAAEQGGIFGDAEPTAPSGPSGPAPAMAAASFDGDAAQYAFQLLPFESVMRGDGRGANRPWLQEMPDPMSTVMWNGWVEISPEDAAALGIHDGDRLRVESESGSVEAQAVLDPAVRPGVLCMPVGNGHASYGRYAEGRGAHVPSLIAGSPVEGTSAPAWAATRVRLTRLGEGELVRFGRSYEDRGEHEAIPVGWAPQDTTRPVRERSV